MFSSFLRGEIALLLLALVRVCVASPTLAPADEVFDIRYDITWVEKGEAAAFALVEKTFAKSSRPHVKARYGELLLSPQVGVISAGQEGRGLELVQEALNEGSVHAKAVLGWELLSGERLPADPMRGVTLLQEAVSVGNLHAMIVLGRAYLHGVGVQGDARIAEMWFRRAAYLGKPHNLYLLGRYYENGNLGGPNLSKACELYYEAATRGSGAANRRLNELTDAGDLAATRAAHLVTLWYAAMGADFQRRKVKAAAEYLEQGFPEDPVVLHALGRIYASEGFGLRSYAKAHAFLERAIQRGSKDARAERALLTVLGAGVKKDYSTALTEWRALEKVGSARALAQLGYYHYWDALKGTDVGKDPAKAYAYSLRAANAGDPWGQLNVAFCYEHGVGVETNYALAARYYRAASWRGMHEATLRMHKLLDHVK